MRNFTVTLAIMMLGFTGCAGVGKKQIGTRFPASADSSACSTETAQRYANVMERISTFAAARSISCSESKVLEAAVSYAQKSGCEAVDYAILMANDVLDQRDERPGYFKQITRPCP